MTTRDRRCPAAGIALPLIPITAYLLWLWPWPRTTSVAAAVGPYLLSLATDLPFAWLRFVLLAGGFVLLWFYAAAVLCGMGGVCL